MLSEVKTQKWKDEIEWRRLSDILDFDYQGNLFDLFYLVINSDVGAQDVKQGKLGDWYFLSVLAAIATNAKEELFDILFMDSHIKGGM